ncbi:hypothetical protein EBA05_16510 [Xanthomonas oryzae pv. oryzae]|nr:hypothetical protein C0L90_16455 [Xanthomonas oryzae pv. oryzae]QBN40193.1 hypothetical protein EBA04_16685 [Xanthomonas oryzae pv. oryzae]QBN43837.1 hypothetical protein EBA05_16510 [Xanthomonas oryzae pv. oryzae]QBN47492.1 hypothetical protein EBA06_16490 [Xanthomonas oryzae pv. oryzae]QBN51120.1 hypothetical protein EBA07_16370 [Xanthomonas oryzae pv. oryzae]
MICSSEKRFFTSNLLGIGNWTPNRCATQTRGDVALRCLGNTGRISFTINGTPCTCATAAKTWMSVRFRGGIANRFDEHRRGAFVLDCRSAHRRMIDVLQHLFVLIHRR